jgi:hypothetical protein
MGHDNDERRQKEADELAAMTALARFISSFRRAVAHAVDDGSQGSLPRLASYPY